LCDYCWAVGHLFTQNQEPFQRKLRQVDKRNPPPQVKKRKQKGPDHLIKNQPIQKLVKHLYVQKHPTAHGGFYLITCVERNIKNALTDRYSKMQLYVLVQLVGIAGGCWVLCI
jgi:hypothetical protein